MEARSSATKPNEAPLRYDREPPLLDAVTAMSLARRLLKRLSQETTGSPCCTKARHARLGEFSKRTSNPGGGSLLQPTHQDLQDRRLSWGLQPRVPVNDDKTAKSLRIWSSVSGYFYEVKTGNKQSKPVLTKYLQDPTTVSTWMKSSKKVKRSVFSRKESTLWRGLLFPGDIVNAGNLRFTVNAYVGGPEPFGQRADEVAGCIGMRGQILLENGGRQLENR